MTNKEKERIIEFDLICKQIRDGDPFTGAKRLRNLLNLGYRESIEMMLSIKHPFRVVYLSKI